MEDMKKTTPGDLLKQLASVRSDIRQAHARIAKYQQSLTDILEALKPAFRPGQTAHFRLWIYQEGSVHLEINADASGDLRFSTTSLADPETLTFPEPLEDTIEVELPEATDGPAMAAAPDNTDVSDIDEEL